MQQSKQKLFASSIFENLPTFTYFALLYAIEDLRVTGWVTASAAALVLLGYLRKWLAPNTIMLGINTYMLAITPVVEVLLLVGQDAFGRTLIDNAQATAFIAIFVVGCLLTAFGKAGFVGVRFCGNAHVLRYSLILLLVSLLAAFWVFVVEAERLVHFGVPLIALFGTQQLLIARLHDQFANRSGAFPLICSPAADRVFSDDAMI